MTRTKPNSDKQLEQKQAEPSSNPTCCSRMPTLKEPPDHTVVLKGLCSYTSYNQIEKFARKATPNVVNVCVTPDRLARTRSHALMVYLGYGSAEQARIARETLHAEISRKRGASGTLDLSRVTVSLRNIVPSSILHLNDHSSMIFPVLVKNLYTAEEDKLLGRFRNFGSLSTVRRNGRPPITVLEAQEEGQARAAEVNFLQFRSAKDFVEACCAQKVVLMCVGDDLEDPKGVLPPKESCPWALHQDPKGVLPLGTASACRN